MASEKRLSEQNQSSVHRLWGVFSAALAPCHRSTARVITIRFTIVERKTLCIITIKSMINN